MPDEHAAAAVIANTSMTQEPIVEWSRFSSFSKCVRVIAFRLRVKCRSQSKILLPSELKRVEERVFKLIQRETFPKFHEEKQTFGRTNKVGDLAKFSPFLTILA